MDTTAALRHAIRRLRQGHEVKMGVLTPDDLLDIDAADILEGIVNTTLADGTPLTDEIDRAVFGLPETQP